MATLKFNEFITFFQLELMCKHLEQEDIQRLLNSFMSELDEVAESKTILSRYYREILGSRLFCLLDKMRNGFKSAEEKAIYIEDVQESIEEYIQSCMIQQESHEWLMISKIFI